MNRGPLSLIVALAIVLAWAAISNIKEGVGTRREAMIIHALSVGWDLIQTTNSTKLTGIDPEFRADLADILASPTWRVALKGDDLPPEGNGAARARLILTNEHRQALHSRLQPEGEPGRFRLLSYRKITEPDGAANGSQPIRLQTNRTSSAAGSRR